jgi:hypothetical protein
MSENPAQRLSDDQVLARQSHYFWPCQSPCSRCAEIPTFIFAGHETTSTAVSWALFELAQRPEFQQRLRAELCTLALPSGARGNEPLDADTLAALERLPLLDAVVRETLRFHPPVQTPDRVATRDTAVPLARPFVDRHGMLRDEIRFARGDVITIPILLVHRSKELWGEDADEWKCVMRVWTSFPLLIAIAGLSAGSLARRRQRMLSPACGATSLPSSAVHTHASAIAFLCSSASKPYYCALC